MGRMWRHHVAVTSLPTSWVITARDRVTGSVSVPGHRVLSHIYRWPAVPWELGSLWKSYRHGRRHHWKCMGYKFPSLLKSGGSGVHGVKKLQHTGYKLGGSRPGHILTVQSNQFYAVQKAECAVQIAKLCSPKYVLWTFTQINNKNYSLICCICSGDGWELAANSAGYCSGWSSFSGYRYTLSASQWRIFPSLIVFGSEANAGLRLPRSAKANASPVVDCLLL